MYTSEMNMQKPWIKSQGDNTTILYGRGAASIASVLDLQNLHGLNKQEATDLAQQYIDSYLDTYPGLRAYQHKVLIDCRRMEYVQTWLKRKRRLPAINSPDRYFRKEAERQVLNSIIQGTGADIVMMAMLACEFDEFLLAHRCYMLMQVHDELIFECPDEHVEACSERVVYLMESPTRGIFRVPITVSLGTGKSWAAAK